LQLIRPLRKLDGKRAIVAQPNRFATITWKNDFRWADAKLKIDARKILKFFLDIYTV